jgi:hypothetical protein
MPHLSRARTPTVIINLIPSCRNEYPSLSFRSNIGRYRLRCYMPTGLFKLSLSQSLSVRSTRVKSFPRYGRTLRFYQVHFYTTLGRSGAK